ncbi:hypothetical protein DPMN_046542 [Dreissena polymorpha]|uniref:Carbohydrate sulfotransferase n=1 Tax=Dreissena polymorpha TaxID=45954 RepID=A0A9D4I0Z0_DREPO|nr:hypothetical protein DPMN_046542 [Dreissena polymorpha]
MFWERFGKPSIHLFRENDTRRCFHDASFLEFVRFVTWAEENKQMLDEHFMTATELCIPCITNYTFIGKMESFGEDSTVIFNKFSKISYTREMKRRMKDLASLDAIVDSINIPFQ